VSIMKNFSRKFLNWSILLVLVLISTTGARAAPKPTIDIQILNVSDWHGQLDPLSVGTTLVGGAAVLSAYWQADRAANPNTLTLTAGDDFGASPPISNFFDEVPAVLAQRLMGIQVNTFGNHNFDRGIAHLQCMVNIAGAPNDPGFTPGVYDMDSGCPLTSGGPGAPFQYVSANLQNRDANLSGVEDFEIFNVGGVDIAVIGLTNPEAPTLVFPGNFGTIVPTDPVKAARKARDAAKAAGADIIMVITHMGVTGFDQSSAPFGPLIDFARAVNDKKNPRIDVIVGDHTDIQFSGTINGALVYENRSKGLTYAKATLTVDANNHKLLSKSVAFVTPLASAVTPDPAIVALLQPYRDALAPILNTQVGSSTVFIPRADACGRADGRLCESLVGNTVTDAMRLRYGVDFAITNSGGLRADLTCPTTDNPNDFCPGYTPPPFLITRGQVLSVLPFGNVAVTLEVNGAELKTMLENGVSAMPGANGRFAQVSGLCFTYDISAPVGSRVTGAVRQDGSCTGTPVDLTSASTYTIAENDFMANGGDGYPNFASRMVTREIMDQVLADYVAANSPISPSIQGRIVCTTTGATACPVVTP
jgi:2',3'-cyclic-nucleotide 2'-phosphodiesterase (5'-nucleotidase family)